VFSHGFHFQLVLVVSNAVGWQSGDKMVKLPGFPKGDGGQKLRTLKFIEAGVPCQPVKCGFTLGKNLFLHKLTSFI
jgi:hypothetical protein